MKLPRSIRFDAADRQVFEAAAEAGERAVFGTFAFADWIGADLAGNRRQAFVNGWLSVERFGRSTFVAVATAAGQECDATAMRLAARLVAGFGAPGLDVALPTARDEADVAAGLCAERRANTLPVVERSFRGCVGSLRHVRNRATGRGAFLPYGREISRTTEGFKGGREDGNPPSGNVCRRLSIAFPFRFAV